ncbi:MAG: futalosine hydrolase, partial [Flavitalea sp.]
VGLVATAISLSRALHAARPDLLIQAGIAGTFDNNSTLGTVYRIDNDAIADLGVEEEGAWKDIFDLKLADRDAAPFSNGILKGDKDLKVFDELPSVSAISVNEITTRKERIKQLVEKYDPVLESMEGAAFHQAAIEHQIPFVQLRSVSNYIGERNKENWKMKDAIINLNEALKNGIVVLPSKIK